MGKSLIMDQDVKAKWVKALRSGEYKQARGMMRVDGDTEGEYGYCCLGVLCDLYANQFNDDFDYVVGGNFETDTLPAEVAEWAGFNEGNEYDYLAVFNDGVDKSTHVATKILNRPIELNVFPWTFEGIADFIEEQF